jgi:HdeA/HdeB family
LWSPQHFSPPGQGSGGRSVDPHLCRFFGASADQMANIMFWLEGYYTEDDDPTTIDFAEFKSTLEKLLVYCSNNPLTAAK